jgi:hypothetical protein
MLDSNTLKINHLSQFQQLADTSYSSNNMLRSKREEHRLQCRSPIFPCHCRHPILTPLTPLTPTGRPLFPRPSNKFPPLTSSSSEQSSALVNSLSHAFTPFLFSCLLFPNSSLASFDTGWCMLLHCLSNNSTHPMQMLDSKGTLLWYPF